MIHVFHDFGEDRISNWLERHGLTAAGIAFLEISKPLAWLSGQLLWAFQPYLSMFADPEKIGRLIEALEKPDLVELIIQDLEMTSRQS